MSELIKMKKDFGTMLVPPAKLQEYLKDGWEEIERVQSSDAQPSQAQLNVEELSAEQPDESKDEGVPVEKPDESKDEGVPVEKPARKR